MSTKVNANDRAILGYEFFYVRQAILILREGPLDNVQENLKRLDEKVEKLAHTVHRVTGA